MNTVPLKNTERGLQSILFLQTWSEFFLKVKVGSNENMH